MSNRTIISPLTKVTPFKDVPNKTLVFYDYHLYKRIRHMFKCKWVNPQDITLNNFKAYCHCKNTIEKYLGFGYKVVFNYNGKDYLLIYNKV